MSTIEYTAKRSLIDGHVFNTKYTMPVLIRTADPRRDIVSTVERSSGGGMEVGLERIETGWEITFLIRDGSHLLALREMLDSTESGETFKLWLYDDPTSSEDPALILKRVDDGNTEIVLARRGGEGLDLFYSQISAVEAVAFDPTTLTPIEGAETDTIDIYDPDEGGPTGGIDPPPPGAPDIGPFGITVGQQITDFGYSFSSFGTLDSNGGDAGVDLVVSNDAFDYLYIKIWKAGYAFDIDDVLAKYSTVTFGSLGSVGIGAATVMVDDDNWLELQWAYAGADWGLGTPQTVTFS